eukprot:TRINITY_DN33406_c0_g1_i1.p1 TRINITY_DN33406_c0_g1~~TRINITY_DN33406_c0_g1_i1.p1  ORF type:complete len:198 (+),score=25.02 TRINITY_DN33406_c0_g1_i1:403-996(+)
MDSQRPQRSQSAAAGELSAAVVRRPSLRNSTPQGSPSGQPGFASSPLTGVLRASQPATQRRAKSSLKSTTPLLSTVGSSDSMKQRTRLSGSSAAQGSSQQEIQKMVELVPIASSSSAGGGNNSSASNRPPRRHQQRRLVPSLAAPTPGDDHPAAAGPSTSAHLFAPTPLLPGSSPVSTSTGLSRNAANSFSRAVPEL